MSDSNELRVRNEIEHLHSDLESRLVQLQARLDVAEKKGWTSDAEKFSKEIDQIKGLYKMAFDRAEIRLHDAKDQDTRESLAAYNRQKINEDVNKAAALMGWLRAGGMQADFEATWPAIREQQAKEMAMRELEKTTEKRSGYHL
jgi:hypothetical protein